MNIMGRIAMLMAFLRREYDLYLRLTLLPLRVIAFLARVLLFCFGFDLVFVLDLPRFFVPA
jgi:hypothetical protein